MKNPSVTQTASNPSRVVVDIKLSEGDNVCLNPAQRNTKYDQYVLNSDLPNYYCTPQFDNVFFDNRYKKIDTIKLSQVLIENNVMKQIQKLPYYPLDTLNADYGLFTREYIGYQKSCLYDEFSSPDYLRENSDKISKFHTCLLVAIILAIITIIFFLVSKPVELNDNSNDGCCFFVSETTLNLFCLAILITLIICTGAINDSSHIFNSFKTMNCGDSLTNRSLTNFGERVFLAQSKVTIIIVLFILLLLTNPLVYTILYFCGSKTDSRGSNHFLEEN